MTPKNLLRHLIRFAPAFENQWNRETNDSLNDDGSFSLHGVCSEFSHYFRKHYRDISPIALQELFDFIEMNLVDSEDTDTPLDNALCTCFLENISTEAAGEFAMHWMGPRSRRFFDEWHP